MKDHFIGVWVYSEFPLPHNYCMVGVVGSSTGSIHLAVFQIIRNDFHFISTNLLSCSGAVFIILAV